MSDRTVVAMHQLARLKLARFGVAVPFLGGMTVLASACADSGNSDGGSGSTTATVNVTLGASSCTPDRLDLAAGKTTFIVRNPGEGKADTFEIRDGKQSLLTIQNVLGGLTRSADANLRPGTYTMHCGTSSSGGEGVIVVTE